MGFSCTKYCHEQAGKIKQTAEFLKLIFFNARRVVYVNVKVTHYYKVFTFQTSFINIFFVNIDLDMSSLSTLVTEVSCYVVYTEKCQVY